jgi:hypothetical protein
MMLIQWIVITLLAACLIVTIYRCAGLQVEIEQLKSQKAQRLTASAPVEPKPSPASRFAGDGQNETKAAGN